MHQLTIELLTIFRFAAGSTDNDDDDNANDSDDDDNNNDDDDNANDSNDSTLPARAWLPSLKTGPRMKRREQIR